MFKKTIITLVAASTIAAGTLVWAGTASARPFHAGWGWGAAGVATGLILGAAAASAATRGYQVCDDVYAPRTVWNKFRGRYEVVQMKVGTDCHWAY